MTSARPYPGFWQALVLCVLLVLCQVALALPLAIFDVVLRTAWAGHPASVAAINLLACAIVMALAFVIGRPPGREVFALRRVPSGALVAASLATIGAVILLSDADNLLRSVLPAPKWLTDLMGRMLSARLHPFWAFVVLVVVAPVTEELLFRGLMLRGMLGRYPAPRAVVLVALLFALVHLNPWQAGSAMALGVLIGWFYVRTRSLLPCLLSHAVANGAVYAVPFLPFEVRGFNVTFSGPVEFQPWWFDALGAAALAAGVWAYARATPLRAVPAPGNAVASGGPAPGEAAQATAQP